MPRIKLDVVGKLFDFGQGVVHLFCRSFKQAADAKVKQRIAGKQGFVLGKIPKDVSLSVSRDVNDFGRALSEHKSAARGNADVESGNPGRVIGIGNNLGLIALFEFQVAVRMVKMVMRVEDILRF